MVWFLNLTFQTVRRISLLNSNHYRIWLKNENVPINLAIIPFEEKKKTLTLKFYSQNVFRLNSKCVSGVIPEFQNGPVENNACRFHINLTRSWRFLKITCIIHIFTEFFHSRRKQGFRVILCVCDFVYLSIIYKTLEFVACM